MSVEVAVCAPSLLVLSCSRRKSAGVRRGPAWEVYDGRVYQVLKKLLRDHPGWGAAIEVVIVSARYGVIGPRRVIGTYDDRITPGRAAELSRRSPAALRRVFAGRSFRAVHANLGRDYRAAVPGLVTMASPAPVEWASGGIGVRNSQTRAWVRRQLAGHRP